MEENEGEDLLDGGLVGKACGRLIDRVVVVAGTMAVIFSAFALPFVYHCPEVLCWHAFAQNFVGCGRFWDH